jgi:predicted ATPase/DNA-binding CsgD family transcriptional regulator
MFDHPTPPVEISIHRSQIPVSGAQNHSLPATNLPHQLTSFVGRQPEIAEVERLLSTARLLTLTGPGGVGKTRLALQVAEHLLPRFAQGVWVVDLAAVAENTLVPQAVAQALGIRKEARRPVLASLSEALKDRQLLVVLDNCEHLVVACAELVVALLRACPQLTILVTSREVLGVGGELVWRVPSLSVPPLAHAQHSPLPVAEDVAQVGMSEAVQLFLERAQAVRPDFCLTSQNAPVLAQVCQRLDGIPLAIELAAARVQVLSEEQLAARLDDRFRLLTGGSRTALPRQQTLKATLSWSHDLLSEPERVLFRRACVFAGSWTLEAAEGVCAGEGFAQEEVLDRLAQLVKKSLVVVETHDQIARYRLLETVRQYGQERLEEAGEDAWMRGRHLAYFLDLTHVAERHLLGDDQAAWVRRLERESANLRVAFDWALESGAGPQALELSAGLFRFWMVHGQEAEGTEWLEEALRSTEHLEPAEARAEALWACGCLATRQSDYPQARRRLEASLTLWRALGNAQGVARARCELGWLAIEQIDLPTAHAWLAEGMPELEQRGDRWELPIASGAISLVAFEQGDYALARARMERDLAQARALGASWQLGRALTHLGELTRFEGQNAEAEHLYEEAMRCFEAVGNTNQVGLSLHNLGGVVRAQGDLRRALALGLEAVLLWHRFLGSKGYLYSGLLNLGGVLVALHETERAARLYGAAERFSEQHHLHMQRNDLAQYERDLPIFWSQGAREHLQAAWVEGRALSLTQAIALVEGVERTEAPSQTSETESIAPVAYATPAASNHPMDLTAREVEVLRLLAQGLTNKQIAEQLVLSPRTVNSHLASIFSKIGVTTRSAATRFAFEHQML